MLMIWIVILIGKWEIEALAPPLSKDLKQKVVSTKKESFFEIKNFQDWNLGEHLEEMKKLANINNKETIGIAHYIQYLEESYQEVVDLIEASYEIDQVQLFDRVLKEILELAEEDEKKRVLFIFLGIPLRGNCLEGGRYELSLTFLEKYHSYMDRYLDQVPQTVSPVNHTHNWLNLHQNFFNYQYHYYEDNEEGKRIPRLRWYRYLFSEKRNIKLCHKGILFFLSYLFLEDVILVKQSKGGMATLQYDYSKALGSCYPASVISVLKNKEKKIDKENIKSHRFWFFLEKNVLPEILDEIYDTDGGLSLLQKSRACLFVIKHGWFIFIECQIRGEKIPEHIPHFLEEEGEVKCYKKEPLKKEKRIHQCDSVDPLDVRENISFLKMISQYKEVRSQVVNWPEDQKKIIPRMILNEYMDDIEKIAPTIKKMFNKVYLQKNFHRTPKEEFLQQELFIKLVQKIKSQFNKGSLECEQLKLWIQTYEYYRIVSCVTESQEKTEEEMRRLIQKDKKYQQYLSSSMVEKSLSMKSYPCYLMDRYLQLINIKSTTERRFFENIEKKFKASQSMPQKRLCWLQSEEYIQGGREKTLFYIQSFSLLLEEIILQESNQLFPQIDPQTCLSSKELDFFLDVYWIISSNQLQELTRSEYENWVLNESSILCYSPPHGSSMYIYIEDRACHDVMLSDQVIVVDEKEGREYLKKFKKVRILEREKSSLKWGEDGTVQCIQFSFQEEGEEGKEGGKRPFFVLSTEGYNKGLKRLEDQVEERKNDSLDLLILMYSGRLKKRGSLEGLESIVSHVSQLNKEVILILTEYISNNRKEIEKNLSSQEIEILNTVIIYFKEDWVNLSKSESKKEVKTVNKKSTLSEKEEEIIIKVLGVDYLKFMSLPLSKQKMILESKLLKIRFVSEESVLDLDPIVCLKVLSRSDKVSRKNLIEILGKVLINWLLNNENLLIKQALIIESERIFYHYNPDIWKSHIEYYMQHRIEENKKLESFSEFMEEDLYSELEEEGQKDVIHLLIRELSKEENQHLSTRSFWVEFLKVNELKFDKDDLEILLDRALVDPVENLEWIRHIVRNYFYCIQKEPLEEIKKRKRQEKFQNKKKKQNKTVEIQENQEEKRKVGFFNKIFSSYSIQTILTIKKERGEYPLSEFYSLPFIERKCFEKIDPFCEGYLDSYMEIFVNHFSKVIIDYIFSEDRKETEEEVYEFCLNCWNQMASNKKVWDYFSERNQETLEKYYILSLIMRALSKKSRQLFLKNASNLDESKIRENLIIYCLNNYVYHAVDMSKEREFIVAHNKFDKAFLRQFRWLEDIKKENGNYKSTIKETLFMLSDIFEVITDLGEFSMVSRDIMKLGISIRSTVLLGLKQLSLQERLRLIHAMSRLKSCHNNFTLNCEVEEEVLKSLFLRRDEEDQEGWIMVLIKFMNSFIQQKNKNAIYREIVMNPHLNKGFKYPGLGRCYQTDGSTYLVEEVRQSTKKSKIHPMTEEEGILCLRKELAEYLGKEKEKSIQKCESLLKDIQEIESSFARSVMVRELVRYGALNGFDECMKKFLTYRIFLKKECQGELLTKSEQRLLIKKIVNDKSKNVEEFLKSIKLYQEIGSFFEVEVLGEFFENKEYLEQAVRFLIGKLQKEELEEWEDMGVMLVNIIVMKVPEGGQEKEEYIDILKEIIEWMATSSIADRWLLKLVMTDKDIGVFLKLTTRLSRFPDKIRVWVYRLLIQRVRCVVSQSKKMNQELKLLLNNILMELLQKIDQGVQNQCELILLNCFLMDFFREISYIFDQMYFLSLGQSKGYLLKEVQYKINSSVYVECLHEIINDLQKEESKKGVDTGSFVHQWAQYIEIIVNCVQRCMRESKIKGVIDWIAMIDFCDCLKVYMGEMHIKGLELSHKERVLKKTDKVRRDLMQSFSERIGKEFGSDNLWEILGELSDDLSLPLRMNLQLMLADNTGEELKRQMLSHIESPFLKGEAFEIMLNYVNGNEGLKNNEFIFLLMCWTRAYVDQKNSVPSLWKNMQIEGHTVMEILTFIKENLRQSYKDIFNVISKETPSLFNVQSRQKKGRSSYRSGYVESLKNILKRKDIPKILTFICSYHMNKKESQSEVYLFLKKSQNTVKENQIIDILMTHRVFVLPVESLIDILKSSSLSEGLALKLIHYCYPSKVISFEDIQKILNEIENLESQVAIKIHKFIIKNMKVKVKNGPIFSSFCIALSEKHHFIIDPINQYLKGQKDERLRKEERGKLIIYYFQKLSIEKNEGEKIKLLKGISFLLKEDYDLPGEIGNFEKVKQLLQSNSQYVQWLKENEGQKILDFFDLKENKDNNVQEECLIKFLKEEEIEEGLLQKVYQLGEMGDKSRGFLSRCA